MEGDRSAARAPLQLAFGSGGDSAQTWGRRGARIHSRIFPCGISVCCPCLPSSWKTVKDWLHLVLILGVLASVVVVVLQVAEIAFADTCDSPFCSLQCISAIVVLPSIYDFFKFIGTYDESLQEHKQRAEDEVSGLIDNINTQVAEMQLVAGKLTESATDFAFRTFDGSREGFEKFILDLNLYYDELYVDAGMLEELRRFVCKWLAVFSQSLLRPETNPLLNGLEEELRRCKSVSEICQKVTARLSALKVSTRLQMVPAESYVLPGGRGEASSGDHAAIQDAGASGSLEEGGPGGRREVQAVDDSVRKCGVSWLRFECNRKFGRRVAFRTIDRNYVREWPLTLSFCCGTITILSRRHLNHILYFVLDLCLILFEGFNSQVYTMLLVIANLICVVSTLACFEQIDEIAQLQRRIMSYRQRSERVQEQNRQANDNWAKVQQLHDLWNYRTQPFLIIMGKLHRALDNKDRDYSRALELARRQGGSAGRDDRLEWLKLVNESLECLDQKLGKVQDWTKQGQAPLDNKWKETIGRQLRDAERQEDMDQLIQVLPLLTSNLRSLQDGGKDGLRLTVPLSSPRDRMRSPSPPASGSSSAASSRPSRG